MPPVSHRTLQGWLDHWVGRLSAIELGVQVAELLSIPLAAYCAEAEFVDRIDASATVAVVGLEHPTGVAVDAAGNL
jgi:hypothetical protein